MDTSLKHASHDRRSPGCRGLTLLACALIAIPTAAPSQTLRGVVYEGDTENPVEGATIEVLRADSTREGTVTTDRRGTFELEVHVAGRYLLWPSRLSYVAARMEPVDIGEHEIVSVVLRMGRAAIPLEPLVVTARSQDRLAGFFNRAEAGGVGDFMMREEIERLRAALASQLVRSRSGIWVTPSEDGTTDLITMRGIGGRCLAEILLDGLPVGQEQGMSIDDFTSPAMLEGVEIYPPNTILPRELPLLTNDCGVVVFWSRRDAFRKLTWTRAIIAGAVGALILLGAGAF